MEISMGKTIKSKSEYTILESIEKFLRLKIVREIIGNKEITDHNTKMLSNFFEVFNTSNCHDQIYKNLAYFVKYDLDDFHTRLNKLRSVPKNSKEWHKIQMGEYGEQIFINKYVENPHMQEKVPGYSTSKAALMFFKKINDLLSELNIKCNVCYGDTENNKHEFRIKDQFNKWFSYDYTIKELNIIIEYHGEHCHPNPHMSAESWNKWYHKYTKESANDRYKIDMYKKKLAEQSGYKYISVWHSENKDQCIERIRPIFSNIECLEFIPKTKRVFILTRPDGTEVKSINSKKFKEEMGISNDKARQMISGKINSFNGYKLRKIYELI